MTTDSLGLWKINMVTQVLTPALYLKYSEVMKEIMKLNIKYTSDIKMYITQDVPLTSAPTLGTPPWPARAHWTALRSQVWLPPAQLGGRPTTPVYLQPFPPLNGSSSVGEGLDLLQQRRGLQLELQPAGPVLTCVETSRNVSAQRSNAAFEECDWGPRWE